MGIATFAAKGRKSIQIQAGALRHWQPSAPFLAARGFAILPDEPVMDRQEDKPHPGAGWRDADLKRAIAVAEKAGLQSYRVEIAADGTISIVVGDTAPEAGKTGG